MKINQPQEDLDVSPETEEEETNLGKGGCPSEGRTPLKPKKKQEKLNGIAPPALGV